MNFTRNNYQRAARNRRNRKRLTRKLKRLGEPLHHRSNNNYVNMNNRPNNHKGRTRRIGLNSSERNSMDPNNWGKTPKSNE